MTRIARLFALLGIALASIAAAAAPDWRFVALSGFDDHLAAVFIDANSIQTANGRANFALIKVLDARIGRVDNITTRVDADCTTRVYREFDVMGNDGSRRMVTVPNENDVLQAERETVIYAAIDMGCGALPLDSATVDDPVADGVARMREEAAGGSE